MNGKAYFLEKTYYSIKIPSSHKFMVKKNGTLKNGDVISISKDKDHKVYKYNGKLRVKEGDEITDGQILSEEGLIIKKKTRSSSNGKVVKIDNENVYVEETTTVLTRYDIVSNPIVYKFEVEANIEDIKENEVLVSFSSIVVNLAAGLGESCIGEITYIPGDKLKVKNGIKANLDGKVVVTDYLYPESYPKLSTLGALGIITNSMNYSLFKEMYLLSTSLGIVSGFGRIPENQKLTKLMKEYDSKSIVFDSVYNRVLLPCKEAKEYIENLDFKVDLG